MRSSTVIRSASAAALAALMLTSARAATWTVVETARDNSHRLAPIAAPAKAAAASADALKVDTAQRYQEMIGFGGALTESSAWVLAQLPADKRLEVIRRYYDPKDGIGYTLGRTHMNSCDFSLNIWSLDDVPHDYDLHAFTLEPMRKWLMPLLQDARKAAGGDANFKLLVSPWAPPAWMKNNVRADDGGELRWDFAAPWANFYVKFVQAMQKEENFPIWAFTVQNEPEAKQRWESCLFTPEQERDFVKNHLGPAFEKAGLLGKVKLLGWDHNRDRMEARADAMLGDPDCAKYLWGLGLHWYVSEDFEASARVHARYPDKALLFTEGCWEGGDKLGVWEHGEGYATQMIGDFKNWVGGYIDWNIVLDQRGGPNHVGNFCDAPIIVDVNTKEVRYSAAFYYIGHFSKFVKPGAHRIASAGGPAALDTIAFQNPDGSVATIVMNKTAAPATFQLAVAGETVACQIPARAIQTYVRSAN
ncbi:MAG: glycoside hydrolase family 30 protein [Opitutae bacterium]|nr:glycoside hydrolase family 30 protein [Opitutae bacterium]